MGLKYPCLPIVTKEEMKIYNTYIALSKKFKEKASVVRLPCVRLPNVTERRSRRRTLGVEKNSLSNSHSNSTPD